MTLLAPAERYDERVATALADWAVEVWEEYIADLGVTEPSAALREFEEWLPRFHEDVLRGDYAPHYERGD